MPPAALASTWSPPSSSCSAYTAISSAGGRSPRPSLHPARPTWASGTCTVTLTSATTGLTTVDGDWTGGGLAAQRAADRRPDPTDVAKRWVDARASLSRSAAANQVGTRHVSPAAVQLLLAHGLVS